MYSEVGTENTFRYSGVPENDDGLYQQVEIACSILHDKAELLATAIPDCKAEDLQAPREFMLSYKPSFLRISGGSGSAGIFVGMFAACTGKKPRRRCFIGRLSLSGKILRVGQ